MPDVNPPPLLQRLTAAAATALSSVWTIALNVIGFIILALIGLIFWKSIYSDQIVIDAIPVSQSLVQRGYTEQIAAKQLQSALMEVASKLAPAPASSQFPYVVASDVPSVAIPTFGMSVNALVGYIKSFVLNKTANVIGGEFVEKDGEVTLILRVGGRTAHVAKGKIGDLDVAALYRTAVPDLLKVTNSYFHAAHLVSEPENDLRIRRMREDQALDILDNVLLANPSQHSNDVIAWTYNLKAVILLNRLDSPLDKDKAKAYEADMLQALRKALVYKPGYPYAYLNAGMYFYRRGNDTAKAISYLRSAIKSDRRLAEAHRYLAKSLAKAGEFEPAFASYRVVRTLRPTEHRSYFEYGDELRGRSRFSEAIAEYETVAELAKTEPLERARALNAIASTKISDKRYLEAESYVAEAVRLAPEEPKYVLTYIELMRLMERSADAQFWQRRYYEINSKGYR
jgi:tetratricopeptide (TPR) repeat protein